MSEDLPMSDDFGISADSPWPKGNHTLDARGADWRSAAYFYSGAAPGEYVRIHGFRQAAELLFTQMLASSVDRNLLVYPFVYNWRHTVELQIKELIGLLARTGQLTIDEGLLRTHNLAKLWSKVQPVAEELIGTGVVRKVEVVATTRIIGQLTKIDPDGQELRYHLRTDGTPSLANQNHIDPPKFQEAMQGCSAFLDGFIEHAFQELEFKREMAEEFGP
ncbi:hypothetical protein ACFVAV_33380 [Nocardia sp. NPDC057663]|uniref:hypothetical protein n=1 Tax=Nocardia sp. NPDC057663 TaxID=3346201 RepID=UPI00366DBF98